jgi:MoxR-like ATPase
VARELDLGPVLRWPITSRSTAKDGLYLYDAIGRVQEAGTHQGSDSEQSDIGEFVHLGALGTALLPYDLPRVLLIDELDKSDIDLPNDLLNVFEEGEFEIPELVRLAKRQSEVTVLTHDQGCSAVVHEGLVRCRAFPIVIITSNGERDFPPAFLRRCLNLRVEPPNVEQLGAMVAAQFRDTDGVDIGRLINDFLERSRELGGLASDQLLNAVHVATELATSGTYQTDDEWEELLRAIWHPLTSEEPE